MATKKEVAAAKAAAEDQSAAERYEAIVQVLSERLKALEARVAALESKGK